MGIGSVKRERKRPYFFLGDYDPSLCFYFCVFDCAILFRMCQLVVKGGFIFEKFQKFNLVNAF